MKPVNAAVVLLVAASLLGGRDVTRGAAEVPEHERVPITDPVVLGSMGFSPTARNVYVWTKAGRLESPDARIQELEAQRYFGPLSSGFSPVFARAFQGRTSAFAYGTATGMDDIFNTNAGAGLFADAQFDTIPDGANIEFFRIWFSDTSAAHNLTLFLIESCLPLFEAGPPITTTLATLTSAGSAGAGSLGTAVSTPATTKTCTYYARARFGDGVFGPGDETLTLYRARLQWARQVGPAPAVATFQDVPTTHPYFTFVEALATTGITSGCNASPPLYCVDNPITRGEMAVFLGRALGLDFGF